MPTYVDSQGREGDISDEDVAAYGGDEELAKKGYTRAQTVGMASRPAAATQAAAPEPKIRLIDRRGYVKELTQSEIDAYGKDNLEKKFGPLRVAGEGSEGGLVGAYKTLAQIPYQLRTAAHYADKVKDTGLEKMVSDAMPATTADDQRRMDNTLVTSAIGGLDTVTKFTGIQTIADVAAAAIAYGGASQAVHSLDKMLGTDAEGALRAASAAAAVPLTARGVQAAGVALQSMKRPGMATVGVDDALLRVSRELGIDPAADPEGFVNALQKRNPGTYAIAQLAGGFAGASMATDVGGNQATSVAAGLAEATRAVPQAAKVLEWATKPGIIQGAAKGAYVGGAYGFFEGVDEVAHKVQEKPDQTASAVASTAFHDIGWGTVTGIGVGAGVGAFGEILSNGSGWLRNRSLVNEGEAAANWATKEQSLRGEMAKIDKQIADIEIASGRRANPLVTAQNERVEKELLDLRSKKASIEASIDEAMSAQDEAVAAAKKASDDLAAEAEAKFGRLQTVRDKLKSGPSATMADDPVLQKRIGTLSGRLASLDDKMARRSSALRSGSKVKPYAGMTDLQAEKNMIEARLAELIDRQAGPGVPAAEAKRLAALEKEARSIQKELDEIVPASKEIKPVDVTGLLDVEQSIAQKEAAMAPEFSAYRPYTPQEQQIVARSSARSASLGKLADIAGKRALSPTVNWSNVGKQALLRGGQFEAGNLGLEMLTGHGSMGMGAVSGGIVGGTGALLRDPMAMANAQRAVATTLAGGAALMGSEGFIQRGLASFFADKVIGKPVDTPEDEAFNFFSSTAQADPTTVFTYMQSRLAPFIGTDLAADTAVKIASVYKYLKDSHPAPAHPDPWTNDPSGVPSVDADEKRRYIESAEVAGDPAVASARITQGLLTKNHIASLEANHPQTLQDIRESYLAKMVELVQSGRWKDVSQGQLQQLKVLFGADVDSPQAVRDLQAQFAAAKEGDPMGGSSDKTAAAPSRYSGHAADTSKSGADKVEQGQ